MSRISHLFLLLFLALSVQGQQKSNDFTKRLRIFDGKLNAFSGKSFMNSKLNSKINNRIRIEEWPSKYSPFGGKRFIAKNNDRLIRKRIDVKTLPSKFPLDERRSGLGNERIMESDLTNHTAAASSVEFRDAVYAQLDRRVDDWMNKVNNVSLQEINRYQFRKGRPSDPGFPVQQAGSEGSPESRNTINPTLPVKDSPSSPVPAGSSYWMGPRKISVSGESKSISRPVPQARPKGGYRVGSKPILGPKKVRVQVGTSK
ncbi:hypothetical protein N8920_06035 [Opitutales bacterium]|nr:hypothetical protein [Opitutales bacterium]MDA8991600.1 hypothetical protein [Opitutales bacterium]